MSKLAGTLVVALVLNVGIAATPGPPPYQPDWPAIAKHVVTHSLELADAWLFVTDGKLTVGKARLIESGALR